MLEHVIAETLAGLKFGPVLCVLDLSKTQTIQPLVKTKVENGKFLPVRLEDMWPYLTRDEFEHNMMAS